MSANYVKRVVTIAFALVIAIATITALFYRSAYYAEVAKPNQRDTTYIQGDPQIIHTPATIQFIETVKWDTITNQDTIYLEKVASLDTTMSDSAQIAVDYYYHTESFWLKYTPAPKATITETHVWERKWYDHIGIGVGIGTDLKTVRLEVQAGFYFTIGDLR